MQRLTGLIAPLLVSGFAVVGTAFDSAQASANRGLSGVEVRRDPQQEPSALGLVAPLDLRSEIPAEWLMAQGNAGSEAERIFNEGYALFQQGTAASLQAAIEKFEAAIPLQQAIHDTFGEARTRHFAGFAYGRLGFNAEALDHYEQALELWQQLAQNATGEDLETAQTWQASTLNNIGGVYDDLGEKSRALEYYNQALPLRRAVGDRGGEARTLGNIGGVYDSLGEKSRALEYLNQALPLPSCSNTPSVMNRATSLSSAKPTSKPTPCPPKPKSKPP